jgi:hypothetical protein
LEYFRQAHKNQKSDFSAEGKNRTRLKIFLIDSTAKVWGGRFQILIEL